METFPWFPTYGSLVRIQIIRKTAHVSWWRWSEVFWVEEGRQRRSSATLRNIFQNYLMLSEGGGLHQPLIRLLWCEELNLNCERILQQPCHWQSEHPEYEQSLKLSQRILKIGSLPLSFTKKEPFSVSSSLAPMALAVTSLSKIPNSPFRYLGSS